MAPLTRPARKQTISDGSSAYIRSPVSGHPSREALPFSQRYGGAPGSPGGSTSTAAGWASGLLHARRRFLLRSIGGGGTLVFAFFGLLLYFGAFDPNPRIGSNIHPYTYQVMPVGDPWARKGIDYTRPPGYWEYMANWNAPSAELAANSPPSTRKCHPDGPLLFIGLFTHPNGVGRRQMLRTIFKPDLEAAKHRIDFKFILGAPPDEDWRYALDQENKLYDDIVILEDVVKDNIDEGKSIEYFEWLTKNLPDPKPKFVMKVDDDTFLVMPNVIRDLAGMNCSEAIYWGTTQGANRDFYGPYMRGLGYGMSWPLASWIGTANMTAAYAIGTEDAKIGKIISSLDTTKEPVKWVDYGWRMGDWDQLKIDVDTVGFHWLKLDHWVPMVKRKAMDAWTKAGRPYRWDWDEHPLPAHTREADSTHHTAPQ